MKDWISLKSFQSFGVEAKAKNLIHISDAKALNHCIEHLKQTPYFILGEGSNVLFVDDFDGLILKNDIKGRSVEVLNHKTLIVGAGAGENWHNFVCWCVSFGFGGLENLALIPGSVGAAPIQNIGAYGVELDQVFHHLEAIDLQNGKKVRLSRKDCGFSYRNSHFKGKWRNRFFITQVYFKLHLKEHLINTSYAGLSNYLEKQQIFNPEIKDIAEAVIAIRQSKLPDPKVLGNAGSFFKNPIITKAQFESLYQKHPDIPNYIQANGKIKLAAGWLIDKCGWKGKVVGNTGCYEKQALVIVNYGAASGKEIWELAKEIKADVYAQFGVELEPEVTLIK